MFLFNGDCGPAVAAQVRRAIAELAATGRLPDRLADDLALIATEMVTNAVRASARRVSVVVDGAPPDIRIVVEDDAPGVPHAAHAQEQDVAGRGLHIISAVAREWGYRPTPEGKAVWARVVDAPSGPIG
jgi:anti-sigma regulatory factor (Ser/Thr protein kinase)